MEQVNSYLETTNFFTYLAASKFIETTKFSTPFIKFNVVNTFLQNIDSVIFKDVIHELAKKLGYRSRDIGET